MFQQLWQTIKGWLSFTGETESQNSPQWELVSSDAPIRGREIYVETDEQRYARHRTEYAQATNDEVKNEEGQHLLTFLAIMVFILLYYSY